MNIFASKFIVIYFNTIPIIIAYTGYTICIACYYVGILNMIKLYIFLKTKNQSIGIY